MKMNFDLVLRRNSHGRYIDLLSIINNARHFNAECSDVEYCFMLDLVKQGQIFIKLQFSSFSVMMYISAVHPRGRSIDLAISRKRKALDQNPFRVFISKAIEVDLVD